jgi:hypothetical protein
MHLDPTGSHDNLCEHLPPNAGSAGSLHVIDTALQLSHVLMRHPILLAWLQPEMKKAEIMQWHNGHHPIWCPGTASGRSGACTMTLLPSLVFVAACADGLTKCALCVLHQREASTQAQQRKAKARKCALCVTLCESWGCGGADMMTCVQKSQCSHPGIPNHVKATHMKLPSAMWHACYL